MREFQNKRRTERLIYSRYTLAVTFVLIIILSNAVWNAYNKYKRSVIADEQSQQELAVLQKRNEVLGQSINTLGTQEGKDREIREMFGLVKDGEKMIVFVDEKEVTAESSQSNKQWWDWILDLFR